MKIYRPVKTNFLSQKFGDNNACVQVSQNGSPFFPFRVISKSENICPVGYKDFYTTVLGMKGHNGDDWMAWRGEPVYFNVDTKTKWYAKPEVDNSGGIGIRVHSLTTIPFDSEELPKSQMTENSRNYYEKQRGEMYVSFLYWHLKEIHLGDKPKIQVGVFSDGRPEMCPEIKFGDLIGFADSTGASSGDHLHHSMKFCAQNSMTIGNDNGYTGAVDMSKWFENIFVGNVVDVVSKAKSVIDYARQFVLLMQTYVLNMKK